MTSEVKINFVVHGLGFPVGKVYKLHVWLPGDTKNAGKWVDKNADQIKKELRDTCHVHSIQHTSVMWTNIRTNQENYGDIILDSTKDASPSNDKSKSKSIEVKPVKDIRKIDLPNIDDADLNKLRGKINIELFKRQHKLSDAEYDFYMENTDLVGDISNLKKICDEYGTDDKFILRKREVRKKIQEKNLID